MLAKAALQDIEKYGNMVYELSLNPAKSSYPTYTDGIKTKADFLERATKAGRKYRGVDYIFPYSGGQVSSTHRVQYQPWINTGVDRTARAAGKPV